MTYVFALKVFKIKEKLGVDNKKEEKVQMGFQTNCIGYEIPSETE